MTLDQSLSVGIALVVVLVIVLLALLATFGAGRWMNYRRLRCAVLNGLGVSFAVLAKLCFEHADPPPAPILTRISLTLGGGRRPRITAAQRPEDVEKWARSVPSQMLRFQRGER